MTQRSLAVLIVLNVVLLGALSVTVMTPPAAEAQFGGNKAYTMIAGSVRGRGSQAAIFVVDLNTTQVAPLFYNGNNRRFEFFGGRTLADDMNEVGNNR
ncbi:MAG: hypothetical protein AAFX76_11200 [Planctomycetota bacterium]